MTAADSRIPRQDTLQLAVRRRGSAARLIVPVLAVSISRYGGSGVAAGGGVSVCASQRTRSSIAVYLTQYQLKIRNGPGTHRSHGLVQILALRAGLVFGLKISSEYCSSRPATVMAKCLSPELWVSSKIDVPGGNGSWALGFM